MNLVDFLLGASAALAALYGADALQAHLRRRHHARRHP
jgi:hypothetical protein